MKFRTSDDLRDINRTVNNKIKMLTEIEIYGIRALIYQTDENEFLNKVIFKIHKEICLPLNPPSVACISSDYIHYNSLTNVIFLPLEISNFLLHLPDIYHEIGHEIFYYINKDIKLKPIKESFNQAIDIVNSYFTNLIRIKERDFGPNSIPIKINNLYANWKIYWLEEFFCDLFACYTLGPAYTWSHIYLTVKNFDDTFKINEFYDQTHPSPSSRMDMQILGLENLEMLEDRKSLLSKWQQLLDIRKFKPEVEHNYAYPKYLLEEIAKVFFSGIKKCSISIFNKGSLDSYAKNTVIKILNKAWVKFLQNPNDFREWEKKQIDKMKKIND